MSTESPKYKMMRRKAVFSLATKQYVHISQVNPFHHDTGKQPTVKVYMNWVVTSGWFRIRYSPSIEHDGEISEGMLCIVCTLSSATY